MTVTLEQEPDRVPRRVLVQATVVIVVAIVASVLAALVLARSQLGAQLGDTKLDVPQPLDATLFDRITPAELMRRSAELRLSSYGWVDKNSGIVHVPLAVAVDRYLSEAR